jgi:CheY-like chemotaxis protein
MIPQLVSPAVASARRVAVIDDDIRFIRLVERILRSEDVEVQPITTLDVDEAICVLAESRCDAAIIDVFMYGSQTGFTLVERLRRDPATANLPIIVASGARREIGKRVGFLQQHRCGVLLKPFDAEELLTKLESLSLPRFLPVQPRTAPHRLIGALQPLTDAARGGS